MMLVAEDHIDREIHEKHMDRLAMRDNQRLSRGELLQAQQSLHALKWILGRPDT